MNTTQAKTWLRFVALPALLFLAGCEDAPPPIRTYEIPKPDVADRTLGAMVPYGDQVWFFKLVGPADAVRTKHADFRQLVGSLAFRGNGPTAEPTWTLPKGWKEEPGAGMRFKTLKTDVDGTTLELSVTPLAVSSNIGVSRYQLANVNRWRDELGLRPIDLFQLQPETEELATTGGATALLVDLAGERKANAMGDGMMGRAPFAGLPKDRPPTSRPPASTAAAPSVEPQYDVPESWQKGAPKAFARASFVAQSDGKEASITLSQLGVAGAELLQNINRWRRQVGLSATTMEQLKQDLKKLPLAEDGVSADYIQIVGPDQTILGAIAIHADSAWFFKLIGDNDLAQKEMANFEAFVKSTRFETSNGN